ncbi:MAG: hypothetical protein A2Y62_20650 [Candidatus Fischerbacteria bacterium RBG_13_37_8]|uniref:Uncharacterized protein n=1 Tax=Candidatus Fischerbacteria bacterium RBG_13_37_8 TaxID=1817863 RepID=A0A1F5VEZ8_9BACT|nr:MAG: hypothetical protein A2Y62_20650 [Candidatus Fischerbacteria bacterium RBG_13_37_8]
MVDALLSIKELVEKENEFIITSHIRPDGDSVATQIALSIALQRIGKKVTILNKDKVPYLYKFLPGTELILHAHEIPPSPRIVFYVECSDADRPELHVNGEHFIVNIDHHITNTMYGDINWIDPYSPAAGAMVYDFLKIMNIELTRDIATNIFAAIAADTGGFRYNLYEKTFFLCQEMVRSGIKAEDITKNLFGSYPASRMKLLGEVLKSMTFEAGGKVVWIMVTNDMMINTQASPVDCEGFIDYVLFIDGVEMALFFKQSDNKRTRVSLRSTGNIDVSPIARKFGGGGHKYAAACTLLEDMNSSIKMFVESLKDYYKKELG